MTFVKGQPRPPNAGRRKGAPNKATKERAIAVLEEAKARGYMLGLDAMREALMHYRSLAARYQPNGPAPDEGKFDRFMTKVWKIGSDTAQYETPKLQSTTLTANIDGEFSHRLEIEIVPRGETIETVSARSVPAVIDHEGKV